MTSLNSVLAKLLDQLKAKSPLVHLLVSISLAAGVELLGGAAGLDAASYTDFLIEASFAFLLGSRTIRHISGKPEALKTANDLLDD